MLFKFITELNQSNSSNYKIAVLEKYSKSKEVERFLKLTYDKINYMFNIRKLPDYNPHLGEQKLSIFDIEKVLELFHTRALTGNAALEKLKELLETADKETQLIIKYVLDRDIHSGISTKQINKVFKKLIPEFAYMRCSLQDSLKNIQYPAMLQVKMDGTYRTFIKNGDEIKSFSRDGKEYVHTMINDILRNCADGAYIGEMICNNVEGANSTEIRYKSNGLLNSLTPPEDVTFYVWDYLTVDEFKKGLSHTPYKNRFGILCDMFKNNKNILTVKTEMVDNFEQAQNILKTLLTLGEEGAIIKNTNSIFKSGTSKEQIKLKPEIEVDVRCIGFTEGNGRFKDSFGAILYKTDDDSISGQVSGITDDMRKYISENRSKFLNKVFSMKATALTSDKDKNYGLMHPRFIEFRDDKDYTDDFERIKNM